MKRNGNQKTNRTYNPQNTKPPIPLDVDEVDSVLERFIRQKYDQQSFTSSQPRSFTGNHTGSTQSSDDQPPPLPPKPGKRFGFGFRSASSTVPSHFSGPSSPPPRSPPSQNRWDDQPLRVNKQSRVFGATVGGNNDNLETKLAQLRDMGFLDEKRNANVLKGLGGNLERTIEQLVRLGERSNPSSRSRTPIQPRFTATSQPPPTNTGNTGTANGISIDNTQSISRTDTGSTGQQSPGIPQQQAFPRALSPTNPYQNQFQNSNPYLQPATQPNGMTSLNQAFSGLQVSQQQPLFPNATGGYPNQAPHVHDPRLQTMTPPVPQAPFHQTNPYIMQGQADNVNQTQAFQTLQQPMPSPFTNHNPLQQQILNATSSNPFFQTGPPSSGVPQNTTSPQPYSPQQAVFGQQHFPQQQMSNQYPPPNPFASQHLFTEPAPQPAQQNNQQAWNPFQQQTILPQQTGRLDKTSILALYNYPHLAPQSPLSNEFNPESSAPDQPPNNPPQVAPPQRSVTMPVQSTTGSKNPFQSSLSPPATGRVTETTSPPAIGRHVSQESVDIGGFQNGRHSPDAFANLSARYVR